jgi:hypothetical protein
MKVGEPIEEKKSEDYHDDIIDRDAEAYLKQSVIECAISLFPALLGDGVIHHTIDY